MNFRLIALIAAVAFIPLFSCSEPARRPPFPEIDTNALKTHVDRISAAEAQGISAGSKGEQEATAYIADAFRSMGLKTSVEQVPLVRVQSQLSPMRITGGPAVRTLEPGKDFLGWTRQKSDVVSINSDLIFVGYGILAPEHEWDDFKNIDVKGKILLILLGGPRAGLRSMFGTLGGDYYGRLAYKLDEAAHRGAAGALVIHDETIDGLSWDFIAGSGANSLLEVDRSGNAVPRLPLEGWLNPVTAAAILKDAGLSLDDLKRKANETNFAPVPLPLRASVEIRTTLSSLTSSNVLATLVGQTSEQIVYSSQWNDIPAGNSALGHLSDAEIENHPPGVAVMLELARALTRAPKPRRSMSFLSVTAEAEGLLGMQHYLENPLFPADKMRAVIHIAGFNPHGFRPEIRVIGHPFEALRGLLKTEAVEQGRLITPEKDPEHVYYFQYTEFELTARGVPSMFVTSMQTAEEASQAAAAKPEFDAAVPVLDARLLFDVGLTAANSAHWPVMRPVESSFVPRNPRKKQ